MPDREKVAKAIEYLNWYFTQDDGVADKDAVDAWEELVREQEPVVPESHIPDETCPACGTAFIGEVSYYLGYTYKKYYAYCPGCGRKVNWNG